MKPFKKKEPEPVKSEPKADCLSCKYMKSSRCHRWPPQVHVTGESIFAEVHANGWCGEWAK